MGYFVLGPSDLYKLVKEIGKFIQNIRTLGTDLTTSFENNMESQLQLQELRKAQQELNDAFSFRRSINTNLEPTAESVPETTAAAAAATTATAAAATATATTDEDSTTAPKRKIRRRVKRVAPAATENPDELEAPAVLPTTAQEGKVTDDPFVNGMPESTEPSLSQPQQQQQEYTPEELAQINADFDKYTLMDNENDLMGADSSADASSSSRFQQQLSGDWNAQILEKNAELEPVAKVMELIALLEQEKVANDARLEQEFRQRAENEQAIYERQRQLLQDAILQVQQAAFASSSSSEEEEDGTNATTTTTTTTNTTESSLESATPVVAESSSSSSVPQST